MGSAAEKSFSKGQLVGIGWQASACNSCSLCVTNHTQLCKETKSFMSTVGGYRFTLKLLPIYLFLSFSLFSPTQNFVLDSFFHFFLLFLPFQAHMWCGTGVL